MEGTSPTCNDSLKAKPKTKTKLTDEEYWKMKRAKNREKAKDNKRKFETKEEYLESEEWKKNQERQKRRRKWRDSEKEDIEFHKPEIVIDLSYSDVMNDKEQGSAVTQLVQMYGILKKTSRPLKTHFCSVTGGMETRLQKAGVENWKVWTHSENFSTVFTPSSLVYLSPDSPNVLEQLDPAKIYVIGGLVDHNKLKGLSYKRATEMGLETARLPMSEILKDKPNTSLNQNHVYNILTDFAISGNLAEALRTHTPNRKGFQKQGKGKEKKEGQNDDKETIDNPQNSNTQ